MENHNLPKIAIVGRPNVGKSSLFNRIAGSRRAIVESASGTTRDRLYADVSWRGKDFVVIDTGGFKDNEEDMISKLVLEQLKKAIAEADIIFFVVDGKAGILPQDKELTISLRKASKKVYLVVNKVDTEEMEEGAFSFFELGLGEPYPVSAMHNTGIDKLLNDVLKDVEVAEHIKKGVICVAIIGRPNVGKSSYLNALLGEERAIVHKDAGTTRDSIDTKFVYKEKDYLLIDTAGMRHKKKIKESTDFFALTRAKEAIKRADVAMVIVDGYDGMRSDDLKIIELVLEEKKGLIIGINKWDLVKKVEMSGYADMVLNKMKLLRNYPVIFISAKSKRNVESSFETVEKVYENFKKHIPTYQLMNTLSVMNNSPFIKSKGGRFSYLTQIRPMPPKFIFFVDNAEFLSENVKNFIENFLRKEYDFKGVPIEIEFKKKV